MNSQIETLKKNLRSSPQDAGLSKELGKKYLEAGYYKEAAEHYRQAINFNPRLSIEVVLDYERHLYENSGNLQLRFSLVNFYLGSGDIKNAIMELEEILEVNPNNLDAFIRA